MLALAVACPARQPRSLVFSATHPLFLGGFQKKGPFPVAIAVAEVIIKRPVGHPTALPRCAYPTILASDSLHRRRFAITKTTVVRNVKSFAEVDTIRYLPPTTCYI